MHSDVLSAFFGTDVKISADILLPDDYYTQPERRFPTIYFVHAFEGSHRVDQRQQEDWLRAQRQAHTRLIVVFLDANRDGGHHAFADSQNYGPWGTALVREFIPRTEAHFRAISDARYRFVSGHSSGGWSSLWLQVSHPDVFGGVWAISPDPVDFHDFTGPDLTLDPPQNFYRDPHGDDYRMPYDSLRHIVLRSPWGSEQFDSFEEVFSPKGADGKPERLFDRKTGTINPIVAKYWEEHWDIDRVLADRWPAEGPLLRGKIHVFVGDRDSFGLDRPVRRMQVELQSLGANAQVTFVPGADHWSVYNYKGSLIQEIVSEIARQI